MSMTEKEALHRHEIEHKALTADISDQNKMFSEAPIDLSLYLKMYNI